jgi:hypothetical protein
VVCHIFSCPDRGRPLRPERDAAKAEAYFDRALAVARQQQAKSWELRAAISMARLWRDQGKRNEARELLARVYAWFTEGFDTRYLKEARVVVVRSSPPLLGLRPRQHAEFGNVLVYLMLEGHASPSRQEVIPPGG